MKKSTDRTNEKKVKLNEKKCVVEKEDLYIEEFKMRLPNNNYKETFKNRFNELLKKSIEEGHQQKEITEKTGISPASITQYKNGINTPKGDILESLANYFNVSTNYLLGKSDTPTYTFDDINKKTGLSQKAIETLYKLQHNCFNENIDIAKEKEISNLYSSHLSILNLILEDDKELLELLDNIKKYKELEQDKKETEEKKEFYEYKLTKNFIYFIQKLVKGR